MSVADTQPNSQSWMPNSRSPAAAPFKESGLNFIRAQDHKQVGGLSFPGTI